MLYAASQGMRAVYLYAPRQVGMRACNNNNMRNPSLHFLFCHTLSRNGNTVEQNLILVNYTTNMSIYRGKTFRKMLMRVGEVRSLVQCFFHVMALTATATKVLREEVQHILGMKNPSVHSCGNIPVSCQSQRITECSISFDA